MAGDDTLRTDVLVVGAGPSGLMAAMTLARLGVDALIIDGKDGPTRESRALAVQARSLEIYDQLGLIDAVLAARTPARGAAIAFRERVLGTLPLALFAGAVSPFTEVAILEQSQNERILVEGLASLDRHVMWHHALLTLDQHSSSVVATVAGPDGPVTVDAKYIIGADGAGSTVREQLGIPFEGVTNEHQFFLVDARGVQGLKEAFVNIRITPDDFLLSFPMGDGGHARIIGVVRDDELDADGELSEPLARARMTRNFHVDYRDSAWFTTYRLHHRVAARFRAGRCFLVGDAGHVHSPAGGQGMNTGLQDAHNLACAIADVEQQGMADPRLDRYESERRHVALKLVATTDQLFATVTSDSPRARMFRGRIIPALGPLFVRLMPRLIGGPRLFGFLSQTRIRYRISPAASRRREKVVGRRLPWTGNNYGALRSLSWQVHGYGAPGDLLRSVAERLGIDYHVFASDPRGRLRPDRLYLVRPDGFVAAHAGVRAGLAAQRRAGNAADAVPVVFRELLQ